MCYIAHVDGIYFSVCPSMTITSIKLPFLLILLCFQCLQIFWIHVASAVIEHSEHFLNLKNRCFLLYHCLSHRSRLCFGVECTICLRTNLPRFKFLDKLPNYVVWFLLILVSFWQYVSVWKQVIFLVNWNRQNKYNPKILTQNAWLNSTMYK